MKNDFFLLLFLSYIFFFSSCEEYKTPSDGQVLSGKYIFRYEKVAFLMADNAFKPSIYGDIKACSFNENYIIVKQKPNRENYVRSVSEELMTYRNIISKDSTEYEREEYEFYRNIIITNKKMMKVLYSKLSPNHNSEDIRNSLIIADSLVENNPVYKSIFKNQVNYWIISHKEINRKNYMPMSKIYGPFKIEEYLKKREELKIPKELQLIE